MVASNLGSLCSKSGLCDELWYVPENDAQDSEKYGMPSLAHGWANFWCPEPGIGTDCATANSVTTVPSDSAFVRHLARTVLCLPPGDGHQKKQKSTLHGI